MDEPRWGFNTSESRNCVLGRSSLLLLKLRVKNDFLAARDVVPRPPRPKRISSAKPDTINRRDDEDAITDVSGNWVSDEIHTVREKSHLIASSTAMGSGSSISCQDSRLNGNYVQRTGDLLTLSHAQVQNENEARDDEVQTSEKEISASGCHEAEFTLVRRSQIKSLQFKQSTFKGASMSAVTMHRNSFERASQPILTSLFPQKGKYKFTNAVPDDHQTLIMEPGSMKSPTMRFGSTRLHQSNSQDLLFAPMSRSSTSLDPLSQKTAMTYGTLRKSNGSVTELFQKSKFRVRNSLRNWKLYTRNLNVEDKVNAAEPTSPDSAPQNSRLYDATSTKPEELDSNWLSLSRDSEALVHQKQAQRRTALPVEIPILNRRAIESQADSVNTKQDLPSQTQQDNVAESFTRPSGDVLIKNPETNKKTPEQESIELLDSVIKSHCQSRHSTLNSGSSLEAAEHRMAVEGFRLDSLPPQNISHGKIEALLNPPKLFEENKIQTGVDDTKSACNTGSKTPPKAVYSPCEFASHQSVKAPAIFETSLPEITVPVVKRGLSVSDVLAQGLVLNLHPRSANSSFGESSHLNTSLNSQSLGTFEMNSIDDSSTSYTESQDFLESEEDLEEMTPCNAAIRKTGWLILKHLLVSKHGKLEKPGRRKWRKFWVKLKGEQLLFYEINEKTSQDESDHPALIISIDGALVQAMPEHATKRNVMCLSTMHGSMYLLQAISQTEVDAWIQAVHMEAAAMFAKQESENTQDLTRKSFQISLRRAIEKLKQEIDEDEKMLKMAYLQNNLVSDNQSHKEISDQIFKWEENAEKNHVHVFRLRCYLASLETTEQPNPQTAIAATCKSSKQTLSGLKLLNATALHSLVISKQLNLLSPKKRSFTLNLKKSRHYELTSDGSQSQRSYESAGKPKKSSLFGSLRGFDTWRGSTSSAGKMKHQRTSVGVIASAFTPSSSSQSSSLKDERVRTTSGVTKKDTSWPILPPPRAEYDSPMISTENSPDTPSDDEILDGFDSMGGSLDSLLLSPPDAWCMPIEYESSCVRVSVSANDIVTVAITENMTFRQLLEMVCQRKQLDSNNHFLTFGQDTANINDNVRVAEVKSLCIRLKTKRQYSIELYSSQSSPAGFSVARPKLLCSPLVIVSITSGSIAETNGIRVGEEIIVLNGELTWDMNNTDVEKALAADFLRLLIQTCVYESDFKSKTWWPVDSELQWPNDCPVPNTPFSAEERRVEHLMTVLENYLKKIVVRPPPVASKLQPPFIRSTFSAPSLKTNLGKRHNSIEDIVSLLIVPPPQPQQDEKMNICAIEQPENGQAQMTDAQCCTLIHNLLQKAEMVTGMCRRLRNLNASSLSFDQRECLPEAGNDDLRLPLSDLEKVWKVLDELVDTEANYVKDLDCLIKRFLEPLHSEGFLANPEMESLVHSVETILNFQRRFLEDISQSLHKDKNISDVSNLNQSLLCVTSAFLQHAAQFKLYAIFSTCHTFAQTLIEQTKCTSSDVRAFLDARNPRQQHSLSLDSYLIKPIQRVLKYPLLLRELLTLSESIEVIDSKARKRLKAALHAMHGVARHINDSQTVHDEFGTKGFQDVMEHAAINVFGSTEIVPLLSLTNLLCYCPTEWRNASDEIISKIKKGSLPEMLVLVFRSAVFLLCRPMKKRDKKKTGTPQQETLPLYTRSDFLYIDIIPGLQLSVNGKCQGDKNILELTNELEKDRTPYRLLCNSTESKQRIVKTVRYVIRECAKNSNENFDIEEAQQVSDVSLPLAPAVKKEDSATPRSDSPDEETLTPTRNRKQNFFYLPPKEEENQSSTRPISSSSSSKNVIAMTIPLPTYEAAVSNTAQSCKNPVSSEKLPNRSRSTTPIDSRSKAAHRRSGLYIPIIPLSQTMTKNSVKSLMPRSEPPMHETLKKQVASYHDSKEFVVTNNPCKPDANSNDGSEITNDEVPSPILTLQDEEQRFQPSSAVHKYSKQNSPARYNMVYGVAPYESKL